MRFVIAALFLIIFVSVKSQTHVVGRIVPSDKWRSILYVIRVDKIRLSAPVLVDSILLDKDGKFDYVFKPDPMGMFYELRQPPIGGIYRTLVGDNIHDNWLHILSTPGRKVTLRIEAFADSLYYSARYSGDKLNESLQVFRNFKVPLSEYSSEIVRRIQENPEQAAETKEKMLVGFIDQLDTLRSKIVSVLDTCYNNMQLAAGIYYLNEAFLGKINIYVIEPYIPRFSDTEAHLINNIKTLSGFDRIGIVLPNTVLLDAEGTEHHLDSLEGRFKVLDFWASWCGPCRAANRQSLPELNEWLSSNNIPLLGISIDEDKSSWKAALDKDETTWYQFVERDEVLERLLRVGAVPHYLILDKNNRVIFESGTHVEMRRRLERLISHGG